MNEKNKKNGKLWALIDKIGTLVLMNLMFLLASLPIVTAGPAWSGLLTAIRYHVRGDKWFDGFRFGFKTRFWRSLLAWNLLLLPLLNFLLDIGYNWQKEYLVPLILSLLVFLLLAIFQSALLILNVYIPTKIGVWLRNGANMLRVAPLQILGAAVLFWLPVLLLIVLPNLFLLVVLLFLAIYSTLAALAATLLLKDALVEYLIDARAEGVLLAEEGKKREQTDKE